MTIAIPALQWPGAAQYIQMGSVLLTIMENIMLASPEFELTVPELMAFPGAGAHGLSKVDCEKVWPPG